LDVEERRVEMARAEEALAVAASSESMKMSVPSKVSTSAMRLRSVATKIECRKSNGDAGRERDGAHEDAVGGTRRAR
jgi:hypothetical protein